MSVNLGLLITAGVLGAAGAYLLMERSLIRILLGLMLAGNGINLLIIVVSGGMGNPPIKGQSAGRSAEADPLAQAMVLTAIVLTMGVAAFVLAMVYRLFVLNRDDDDVDDDTEDVKILGSSLHSAPDRDRSDDPLTGADTLAGDYFDDNGNPITAAEFELRWRRIIQADRMPDTSDDVSDELGFDDSDESDDSTSDDSTSDDDGVRT